MILKQLGVSISDIKELVSMFDLGHPIGLMGAVSRIKNAYNISEKDAISLLDKVLTEIQSAA